MNVTISVDLDLQSTRERVLKKGEGMGEKKRMEERPTEQVSKGRLMTMRTATAAARWTTVFRKQEARGTDADDDQLMERAVGWVVRAVVMVSIATARYAQLQARRQY